MIDKDKLNENQRKAVEHVQGTLYGVGWTWIRKNESYNL